MILIFKIKTSSVITLEEMEDIKDWIWDTLDQGPEIDINVDEISYEIKNNE